MAKNNQIDPVQHAVHYYQCQLQHKDAELFKIKELLAREQSENKRLLTIIDESRRAHAEEILSLHQQYAMEMQSLDSRNQNVLGAARMAHSAQLAAAGQNIADLQSQIKKLKESISEHAFVDTQSRYIELRMQRLRYVRKFTDEFKATTKKTKLPLSVQSLIIDFMSNELLEDLHDRPQTVGKIAFEEKSYDLSLDRLVRVGNFASDKHLEVYGVRPPKYMRFVGGIPTVEVNYYAPADRWMVLDAIKRERLDTMGVPARGLAY